MESEYLAMALRSEYAKNLIRSRVNGHADTFRNGLLYAIDILAVRSQKERDARMLSRAMQNRYVGSVFFKAIGEISDRIKRFGQAKNASDLIELDSLYVDKRTIERVIESYEHKQGSTSKQK